jgi:hypothetical protein
MDRGAFADDVVVADFEPARLAVEFLVGRIFADGRELEDAVALAEFRRPFQILTLLPIFASAATRAVGSMRTMLLFTTVSAGAYSLRSAHRMVASQASSPSTVALHWNL